MAIEIESLSEQECHAILGICILAAFADGNQEEGERTKIERILQDFGQPGLDLTAAYQGVLGGKFTLPDAANQLEAPRAKALAYEMALCVCQVDGLLQESEKHFLASLRKALQLPDAATAAHEQTAQALVVAPISVPLPPVIDRSREAELDKMILNASILNGALEIMPQTLATMAIIPLQMRLVYQIGKRYGFELDRGHARDFLATVGVGLTSQVFEGYTRKLIGGLTRRLAGRLVGALAGQATGSAFAFATTYALGHVAKRYYASGRTLTVVQLKEVFSLMLKDAGLLQDRYSGEIAERARQVNVSELLPLMR